MNLSSFDPEIRNLRTHYKVRLLDDRWRYLTHKRQNGHKFQNSTGIVLNLDGKRKMLLLIILFYYPISSWWYLKVRLLKHRKYIKIYPSRTNNIYRKKLPYILIHKHVSNKITSINVDLNLNHSILVCCQCQSRKSISTLILNCPSQFASYVFQAVHNWIILLLDHIRLLNGLNGGWKTV